MKRNSSIQFGGNTHNTIHNRQYNRQKQKRNTREQMTSNQLPPHSMDDRP